MRLPSLCLLSLLIASCAPAPIEPVRRNNPATLPVRAENYPRNTGLPLESSPRVIDTNRHTLELKTALVAGAKLNYLAFDTRNHTLEVVDQSSPGAQFQSAAQVTKAKNAIAAINGGFFTPAGKPLGLLYQNGTKVGSLNTSSSLGSGVLYVDRKLANPVIARRASFQNWLNDSAFDPLEVLQSGPFLVESGRATSGLSNEEPRVRSLLMWDGNHHFAIAQCEPITLKNLGGALAKQPLEGFRVQVALNLDGGRSADFNVSSKALDGPLNLRRWWNKPVRNYVIVKPQ